MPTNRAHESGKLGIIGGLGPMATVYFIKKIILMTDASCDQEHIPFMVEHCPTIPDRTQFLLGQSSEDPLPAMVEAGTSLASAGCSQIAIPCVTAHCFREQLQQQVPIAVQDGVVETALYLAAHKIKAAGIMATQGTVATNIFDEAFATQGGGCHAVYPDEEHQRIVTELIYESVKTGRTPDAEKWNKVCQSLAANGAQVIVLGCTELGVIADDYRLTKTARLNPGRQDSMFDTSLNYLDVLDVLAMNCVTKFGKLKKEFVDLL